MIEWLKQKAKEYSKRLFPSYEEIKRKAMRETLREFHNYDLYLEDLQECAGKFGRWIVFAVNLPHYASKIERIISEYAQEQLTEVQFSGKPFSMNRNTYEPIPEDYLECGGMFLCDGNSIDFVMKIPSSESIVEIECVENVGISISSRLRFKETYFFLKPETKIAVRFHSHPFDYLGIPSKIDVFGGAEIAKTISPITLYDLIYLPMECRTIWYEYVPIRW